ncbi:MAG TPA: hypothetical protein VHG69_06695 [Thermoleophilaceae bacterium]|nr:hypothetical protein [Thermoleophilaceae bacterium]
MSAPADASREQVVELAKRLEVAGMRVEQTLPDMGVISGAVDGPEAVHELRAIAGEGASVEEDRGYQLPHPDDPVQ